MAVGVAAIWCDSYWHSDYWIHEGMTGQALWTLTITTGAGFGCASDHGRRSAGVRDEHRTASAMWQASRRGLEHGEYPYQDAAAALRSRRSRWTARRRWEWFLPLSVWYAVAALEVLPSLGVVCWILTEGDEGRRFRGGEG